MRLFDAIVEANHRAAAGDARAGLRPGDFPEALPVIALTCIDPRLNPLIPEVLGLPEEHFIWLRNAGNIITGPMSSTMRSLALACAIKGGKEIAIIGHTECRVRQATALDLTEGFRKLGIGRAQLPENLNEFFGLFASENQNVLRAVEFVRQSPLIGSKVPVHGLLLSLSTGKLDWLVNGYQVLETATTTQAAARPMSDQTAAAEAFAGGPSPMAALPEFKLTNLQFADVKIGELATKMAPLSPATAAAVEGTPAPAETGQRAPASGVQRPRPAALKFDPKALFKIVGEDRKIYGPVPGSELEKWLADDRITLQSLAQRVGLTEWKQLATFALGKEPPKIPLPPELKGALRLRAPWRNKK